MLFGSAEAFYRPAASGLLPQTVPEDEIQEATALVTTVEQPIAHFAGPALATVLVLGLGPATAFALDAATFLFSAALLVRVKPRERGARPQPHDGPRTSVRDDLRAGFEEVRVAPLGVGDAVGVLRRAVRRGGADARARPAHREGRLRRCRRVRLRAGRGRRGHDRGVARVGLRWRPRYPVRAAMLLALPWCASVVPFAAGAPLAIVLPCMAIAGAGIALFDILWVTALAERMPPDKLSRVTSYDWTVSLALLPLGCVLAGPAAAQFGATDRAARRRDPRIGGAGARPAAARDADARAARRRAERRARRGAFAGGRGIDGIHAQCAIAHTRADDDRVACAG